MVILVCSNKRIRFAKKTNREIIKIKSRMGERWGEIENCLGFQKIVWLIKNKIEGGLISNKSPRLKKIALNNNVVLLKSRKK